MIVTSVTVRVPAKINLQLAVGPLRPDGYHGLVTVFHAIGLFDMVSVAAAEADSVAVTGEGYVYSSTNPTGSPALSPASPRPQRTSVPHNERPRSLSRY